MTRERKTARKSAFGPTLHVHQPYEHEAVGQTEEHVQLDETRRKNEILEAKLRGHKNLPKELGEDLDEEESV